LRHLLAQLSNLTLTKNDAGGVAVAEIQHGRPHLLKEDNHSLNIGLSSRL
jgi:hypothetical protein